MKRKATVLTFTIVLVVLSLLVASVPSLNATDEAPQLQWSKTYGTYEGYSVIQTTDGGYAVSGVNATYGVHGYNGFYPICIKTDASGEVQWAKTYSEFGVSGNAYSIVQTTDSGYILSTHGGHLLKLYNDGNVQWNKTYGLLLGQSFAIQASDGGYVLIGSVSNSVNRDDIILVKTDDTGVLLWNKTFSTGTSSSDVFARAVMETKDGGYALTGEWGNSYFWLATTDSEGNLLANQTYNVSNMTSYSESFASTADGGYILAGGDGSNAWLVKTDAQGNMQWKRSYAGRSFVSVAQTVDGGYIAAEGNTLVKLDTSGNVQWDTGNLLSDKGLYSVIVTEDGGYAVAGGSEYNVWLGKFAPESATSPNETAPFPTIWIAIGVIILTVVGIGLLVYLRKRKKKPKRLQLRSVIKRYFKENP